MDEYSFEQFIQYMVHIIENANTNKGNTRVWGQIMVQLCIIDTNSNPSEGI